MMPNQQGDAFRIIGVNANAMDDISHEAHSCFYMAVAGRFTQIVKQNGEHQYMGVADALEYAIQHIGQRGGRVGQFTQRLERAQRMFIHGIAVKILVANDSLDGAELRQIGGQ